MTNRGIAGTVRRRRAAVSALTGALLVLAAASNARAAGGVPAAAVTALTVGKEVAVSAARPGNVQLEPSVAWNGNVYFVAWEEVTPFVEGSQIYGARVSASGKVLDPGGILLSSSDPNQNQDVKVAAGNGRFLVVWAEDRGGEDIRGALVSGAGSVVKQWFISAAEDAQIRPDVAWNGAQFFVVWADLVEGEPFDIYGTRVTWSGTVRDCCTEFSHGLPVNESAPGDQVDPTIAAIPTGSGPGLFMITWTDELDPADPDLRGSRVTNAAVPLDGTGFLVSGASGTQSAVRSRHRRGHRAGRLDRRACRHPRRFRGRIPAHRQRWRHPDSIPCAGPRSCEGPRKPEPAVSGETRHRVPRDLDGRPGGEPRHPGSPDRTRRSEPRPSRAGDRRDTAGRARCSAGRWEFEVAGCVRARRDRSPLRRTRSSVPAPCRIADAGERGRTPGRPRRTGRRRAG